MIDKNKKYKTRDGKEVRIYATDGCCKYTVHGAVLEEGSWHAETWSADGKYYEYSMDYDLVEVKSRIKRNGWVNVYSNAETGFYNSKENADNVACGSRLACVEVNIECEEGEGL